MRHRTCLAAPASRVAVAIVLIAGLTACIGEGLPEGPSPLTTTISVTGVVVDAVQAPLDGTQVQVVSGGMLHTATTNAQGVYAFSSTTVVSGPFTVRASKPGFVTAVQSREAPQAGGSFQVDFTLTWSGANGGSGGVPPFNLTGQHTLTLVAAEACNMLPAVARSRTYLATANPPASSPMFFEIALSEASLFPRHDRVDANTGTPGSLYVSSPDDGLTIVEVLGDGSHVEFFGAALIQAWSNDVSAPFNGTISYCSAGAPASNGLFRTCTGQSVHCTSPSHQVRLTRR